MGCLSQDPVTEFHFSLDHIIWLKSQTNDETNRVLFPILKKVDIEWCSIISKYSFFIPIIKKQKEYSFQYSKWLILSGLYLYQSTLLDTNNKTNRVLFPILKKVHIFYTNNETNRVLFPIVKMVDIEWSSFISK